MSERDELIEQLRASEVELIEQRNAIEDEAKRLGCKLYQLRSNDGGFVAAPVLVALANVQTALLDVTPVVELAVQCGAKPPWATSRIYTDLRCVRADGHDARHRDNDGDEWDA